MGRHRSTVWLASILATSLLSGCIFLKSYKRDEKAAEAVKAYIKAENPEVPKTLSAVLAIGPGAMPDLRDTFANAENVDSRTKVIHAAATIAKPASLLESILTMGLSDADPSVRQVAAFRCTQFPSLAPTLSQSLRPLLRDVSAPVRSAAFSALGSYPPPHTLSTEELIRGMRDADFGVSAQAAAIATKRPEDTLQHESQQTLVNLLTALEDPSPANRAAVVFAFGQFGKKASPVVQPLSIFMQREQIPEVKLQAALALVRIGTPPAKKVAVPLLRSYAKSRNPIFKSIATDALAIAEGKKQ
jgi:HEAT repeat protein